MSHDHIVGLIGVGIGFLLGMLVFKLLTPNQDKFLVTLREAFQKNLNDKDKAYNKAIAERNDALEVNQDLLRRMERAGAVNRLFRSFGELYSFASWAKALIQNVEAYRGRSLGHEQAMTLRQMFLALQNFLNQRGYTHEKVRIIMEGIRTESKVQNIDSGEMLELITHLYETKYLPQALAKVERSISPAASGQRPVVKAKPVQEQQPVSVAGSGQPESQPGSEWEGRDLPKASPVTIPPDSSGSIESLNDAEEGETTLFQSRNLPPSSAPVSAVHSEGEKGSLFDTIFMNIEPAPRSAVPPSFPPASAGGVLEKTAVGIADTLPSRTGESVGLRRPPAPPKRGASAQRS